MSLSWDIWISLRCVGRLFSGFYGPPGLFWSSLSLSSEMVESKPKNIGNAHGNTTFILERKYETRMNAHARRRIDEVSPTNYEYWFCSDKHAIWEKFLVSIPISLLWILHTTWQEWFVWWIPCWCRKLSCSKPMLVRKAMYSPSTRGMIVSGISETQFVPVGPTQSGSSNNFSVAHFSVGANTLQS